MEKLPFLTPENGFWESAANNTATQEVHKLQRLYFALFSHLL